MFPNIRSYEQPEQELVPTMDEAELVYRQFAEIVLKNFGRAVSTLVGA